MSSCEPEKLESGEGDYFNGWNFFDPGIIERLIKDGRIPVVEQNKDSHIIIVPPSGVEPGDSYEVTTFGNVFYSPQRKLRGIGMQGIVPAECIAKFMCIYAEVLTKSGTPVYPSFLIANA